MLTLAPSVHMQPVDLPEPTLLHELFGGGPDAASRADLGEDSVSHRVALEARQALDEQGTKDVPAADGWHGVEADRLIVTA